MEWCSVSIYLAKDHGDDPNVHKRLGKDRASEPEETRDADEVSWLEEEARREAHDVVEHRKDDTAHK